MASSSFQQVASSAVGSARSAALQAIEHRFADIAPRDTETMLEEMARMRLEVDAINDRRRLRKERRAEKDTHRGRRGQGALSGQLYCYRLRGPGAASSNVDGRS